MSFIQKIKCFFTGNFKNNDLPKKVELTSSKYFELSAAEWKVLIREHITPIIEKELQMKQIGDYLWASEYNSMGMRKVLSFFWINSAYATFKWGWNFKFMPKYSRGKVVWTRTDKSVFTHIYEVSKDFYDSSGRSERKRKAYDRVIVSRIYYNENNSKDIIVDMTKDFQKKLKALLPTIKRYYNATNTLESVLSRIDLNMENYYYRFINPELVVLRVFILYRLNLKEEALSHFEKISFTSDDIREQYYKKLLSI
ncbi:MULTISPECIES: hypothetical protein [unclassified Parvimonas]|uniref:hypothetical protein n=1 Tax=unclassified Parvimonas TaxID=1151464 RepID=UPI002B46BBFF|nr:MULTISPECIES: hypothetical protein [unclassified Parvimonas]MEB3024277.1 hypothetical protein [Parvimonas sp. M13]MEB3088423.1 hypothetical protein [Parvimonas sp. M20]